MPETEILFYREGNEVPVYDEVGDLPPKAQAQVIRAIELLAEQGHEARRPLWDHLKDAPGLYELRAHRSTVQYRILAFFWGQAVVVLAHFLTKEDTIPAAEITRARRRKERFEADPENHAASR